MLVLTLTALARDEINRPWVGWVLAGATVAWGIVCGIQQLKPHPIDPLWVTIGDAVLASFALLAPGLSASLAFFYGGFPGIAVVCAAARSRKSGWLVAAVLSLVTLVRFPIESPRAAIERLSSLVSYLILAGTVGWAVHVIYRTDEARRLAEEARARAEEHGRVATHLHDSVLQTLALIQREPDAPNRVVTLARSQERELRDWLYGTAGLEAGGLVEAVRNIAAEIEDTYGVSIEVVAVGDTDGDLRVEGLLGAAREAMINAAKHSGDAAISVYVEVDPERLRLFVRDRGVGFEPSAVPSDRRGLKDSIQGRLAALGGTAEIRSSSGQGTEVRLEVNR
jgi:signal transduction histidine kinase